MVLATSVLQVSDCIVIVNVLDHVCSMREWEIIDATQEDPGSDCDAVQHWQPRMLVHSARKLPEVICCTV